MGLRHCPFLFIIRALRLYPYLQPEHPNSRSQITGLRSQFPILFGIKIWNLNLALTV
jgi:hypothetical protein